MTGEPPVGSVVDASNRVRDPMTVWVHNIDQSQPMIFRGVDNTYIKEGFYCMVFRQTNRVMKFPIARIFRIMEPYEVGMSEAGQI